MAEKEAELKADEALPGEWNIADLEQPLARYIAARMDGASDVRVSGLVRIAGGASQHTYRFVIDWIDEGGSACSRRLIMRRTPAASLLDTKQAVEFAVYRAFRATTVPVPEMLWIEDGSDILGAPFFIAEELSGFAADAGLLQSAAYLPLHDRIAQDKWSILGAIAAHSPSALGLDVVLDPVEADGAWRRELGHWVDLVLRDLVAPQPVTLAAIRWLRANPPPPAQKLSVVHGDFRTGNFLYDSTGRIRGILDWEMAHIGDPLEDLAWTFNRVWCYGQDERAGGLAPRDRAIAIWEEASGLKVDPAALKWWLVLNGIKGQAIWQSAAHTWNEGRNRDVILAFSSWYMENAQDRAILSELGAL